MLSNLRSCWLLVLLGSSLLHPREARSEQTAGEVAGPVSVGTRVRLLAPTAVQGPLQGTVMEMDKESLLISTDDRRPLRVSRQAITQLDVSTGRRGHARTGLIVGVAVGAVVGAVLPLDAGCTQAQLALEDKSCVMSRGEWMAVGVVGYGGAGALIGHLIKGDRWSSVPPERIHVSLGPTRGRGAQLTMSLRW